MGKGLKPHVIEVTIKGKIDGACDGKNAWDDLVRSQAPRHLDVYIVHVKDHNPIDMASLQAQWMGFLNTTMIFYAKRI
jgi:hypothetical protein